MAKVEVECNQCGKLFLKHKSQVKEKNFCCRECYFKYPRPKGTDSKKFTQVEVKCDWCGKSFFKHKSTINKTNKNCCSILCRNRLNSKTIANNTNYKEVNCSYCGTSFRRKETTLKLRPAKNYFCSTKCKNDYLSLSRGGFTPQSKKCLFCQKEFTIYEKRHRSRKYCSI